MHTGVCRSRTIASPLTQRHEAHLVTQLDGVVSLEHHMSSLVVYEIEMICGRRVIIHVDIDQNVGGRRGHWSWRWRQRHSPGTCAVGGRCCRVIIRHAYARLTKPSQYSDVGGGCWRWQKVLGKLGC